MLAQSGTSGGESKFSIMGRSWMEKHHGALQRELPSFNTHLHTICLMTVFSRPWRPSKATSHQQLLRLSLLLGPKWSSRFPLLSSALGASPRSF